MSVRRCYQDYLSWRNFGTRPVWQACADTPHLAGEIISQHLSTMLLVNPSEQTSGDVAATIVAATHGDAAAMIDAGEISRVFVWFKARPAPFMHNVRGEDRALFLKMTGCHESDRCTAVLQARIKQLAKGSNANPYIPVLPATPRMLLDRHPTVAMSLYNAQNPPVTCPLNESSISMIRSKLEGCMRGNRPQPPSMQGHDAYSWL